ncbi:hypothetical protein PTKIN_Ptkin14bG0204400 [Pterospermum kingtungense]
MLWSGLVPPKVESFCWQLLKGRVAVKDNLVARNVIHSSEAICSFCGCPGESINHIFFSCYGSWCIWTHWCKIWGIKWAANKDAWSNFIEWQFLLPTKNVVWKISFCAILWSIWLHRNEIVFKNGQLNICNLIDLIKLRIMHWVKAKWPTAQVDLWNFMTCLNEIQIPSNPIHIRPITSWSCPPLGYVKFNVDGASLGKPGQEGIGGILCDHQGRVLIRFSKSIGLADSNLAELLAIREALIVFSSSSWAIHGFLLESDSKIAVNWVNNPLKVPWKFQNFISQIENLKKVIKDWRIDHVFREGNQEADLLAKEGINRTNDLLFITDIP